MKQFFKFMFASMLGFFLTCMIFFFMFIVFIAAIVALADKEEVVVKNNSVLEIKLDLPVSDRSSNNPFDNFDFSTFRTNKTPGLDKILKAINNAKTDDQIKGIYLDLSDIPSGIATIQEIRSALADFKKSGKFIISYGETYSQGAYYLATVSDKLYLNPEGDLLFKGLAAELVFFKGALDKLDIQPQIIRHGKFKSAVEPFISDKMSAANKEQTITYIQALWNHILKSISESRKISVNDLNSIADDLKIQSPQDAYNLKFVDSLIYKDEVLSIIKNKLKISDKKDIHFITISKYCNAPVILKEKKLLKNKIAVIYALGEIQSGEGNNNTIGSESLSKAISDARKDSSIKAVVLRINSPGGSALASEIIWREVGLTKKIKPVVVSMGDVAASGGYYIACAADTIVADETTITGSIGVFSIVPNLEKFLKNKIGVTFDVVKTNKNADYISVFRALTPYEYDITLKQVERIYHTFIKHVADGRGLTTDQVDSIGQGRVWSGTDAKRLGLVDCFGGLNEAVNIAAYMAKLKDYRIVSLPEQKEAFQQLIENLKNSGESRILKNKLGKGYDYYSYFETLKNIHGVQARLPYFISIY